MYNELMLLVSINIWGGRVYDPLISFINKHKEKTDIFFFQEVFRSDRNVITHENHSNIINDLISLLPEFDYYYSATATGHDTKGKVDFPLEFGQATFIRKGIKVNRQGDVFVHKKFNEIGEYYEDGRVNFPRNFIYSEIEHEDKKFLVLNLHGLWQPAPKIDIPERIMQSQIIIDFIKENNLPTIVAGDFNLRIETKALQMFEDEGMRNLTKESKATTTRSRLYDAKYIKTDKFADYVIVTKGIWVNDFKILKDVVSDHLPLYLKFEV